MESSLLINCCGVFVVFVVDYVLSDICCGMLVVESPLLNSCCGVIVVFVVESLLWNLCF